MDMPFTRRGNRKFRSDTASRPMLAEVRGAPESARACGALPLPVLSAITGICRHAPQRTLLPDMFVVVADLLKSLSTSSTRMGPRYWHCRLRMLREVTSKGTLRHTDQAAAHTREGGLLMKTMFAVHVSGQTGSIPSSEAAVGTHQTVDI